MLENDDSNVRSDPWILIRIDMLLLRGRINSIQPTNYWCSFLLSVLSTNSVSETLF